MSPNILCEVRVDRLNEKGVFVAEQIFNILHNTVDESRHGIFFKHQVHFVPYTFEIANVGGVIRFFIGAPESHIGIFKNQVYAHFPNVEIHTVGEYFPSSEPLCTEMKLAKEYIRPIKIYTDLKDRSEKETIDPLSSITSALAKASKEEPLVLQVCFSPILDSEWKSENTVEIMTSHRPKWLKKFLLSPAGHIAGYFAVPFSLLYRFAMLVARGSASEDHGDESHGSAHSEELAKSIEEKTKSFGYSVSVRAATFVQDPVIAKSLLRELTTSLSILNRPNSNALVAGSAHRGSESLRNRVNGHQMILNSAELAGLIHMPTIYVKTPGINWVMTKKFEPPANLPLISPSAMLNPAE